MTHFFKYQAKLGEMGGGGLGGNGKLLHTPYKRDSPTPTPPLHMSQPTKDIQ